MNEADDQVTRGALRSLGRHERHLSLSVSQRRAVIITVAW